MARKPWQIPCVYNEDRFYDDDEMRVAPVFSDGIPELEPDDPDQDQFDDDDDEGEDGDYCDICGNRADECACFDDDEEFSEDDDAESED